MPQRKLMKLMGGLVVGMLAMACTKTVYVQAPAPAPTPVVANQATPEQDQPAPPPAGRLKGAIGQGTMVRILSVDSEDSYFDNAAKLIGLVCRATGDLDADGKYYAGPLTCDNGVAYYFYRVELGAANASDSSGHIDDADDDDDDDDDDESDDDDDDAYGWGW